MTMIREEPPTDFEIAVRVARRLWKFSDAAISFAGSSENTRVGLELLESAGFWVDSGLSLPARAGYDVRADVMR